jgi:hypothetical protein
MVLIVTARKVPTDRIIGDGKEAALRAVGAFDFWFLAQTWNPLVGARGLIAGLAGLATLKAARINLVASTEE